MTNRKSVLSQKEQYDLACHIKEHNGTFQKWDDALAYFSKVMKRSLSKQNITSAAEACGVDMKKKVLEKRTSVVGTLCDKVKALEEKVENKKTIISFLHEKISALEERLAKVERMLE